jgi:hypothetical protein
MNTGFWRVPGRRLREKTIVHIQHGGRPFCGIPISDGSIFQWCCDGVRLSLIECGNCKAKYTAHLMEILERVQAHIAERVQAVDGVKVVPIENAKTKRKIEEPVEQRETLKNGAVNENK